MQAVERQAATDELGFWDRPVLGALPIRREVAFYAVLFAFAAILRFWDLGARMLHHDESLHATY